MSVRVETIRSLVPGVLGMMPDDHGIRALLRFAETERTIAPMEDLGVLSSVRPTGSLFPGIVDGYTSRARAFTGTDAIVAADMAGRALLERTVSVVAIVEWDHAATSGPDAIVAHGAGGSSAERRSWHLRLVKLGAGVGRLQWVWENRAGLAAVQPGGDFFLPDGGYMLVSATREWCGDRFELRYWVGETLLAAVESTDLEVGGGIGASVTIGCVGNGVGGYAEQLHGRLDQLGIFAEALTQPQVSHLWQRLAVWPADVYAAARDLQPPGTARSRDPESWVQRRIRVHSGMLAATSALVALRQDAGLPDRAFGPRLVLWERATGQVARPGESVETRRSRVLAALRGEQGLTDDAILESLGPLYGLAPGDLEVIRYDNITRGIDPFAWEENGDGTVLIDAPLDEITLRVPAAASYSTTIGGYAYRTAVADEPTITATVEATSLSNDDLFVGLSNGAGTTLAGLKLDTSALQVVNTLTGANVQAYVLPVTVRVYRDGAAVKARINAGAEITLGTPASPTGYAQVSLVPVSASVPGSARSARLSDVRVQQLDSRSTQCAYIYADAATDLVGARRQLARQEPAHVHCAALAGRRAVRCDDAIHGADSAPLAETQYEYAQAWFGTGLTRAWAGTPVDLVAGATLVAAGAATYNADTRSYGPFGDQALVMAAGTADKWTTPSTTSLQFTNTGSTAFVMVFNVSSFSLGTSYTLIGNRAGVDLQGFEVAIDAGGNLVVRFDAGAGAPVELSFQPCNTLPGWRGLAVRYNHVAGVITAATENQVLTAAFTGNAASTIATALGAYRALQTPNWRCGLLAVLEGAAAQAFDPVLGAVGAHRAWANLFDHPAELRRDVSGLTPDVMWSGSTIDDVGLAFLSVQNGATLVQGPYLRFTGPNVMSLASTQAWVAQAASVVQFDERPALFILAVNLTSVSAGVFNSLFGNLTGSGASDAGMELTVSSSSRITFNVDDATGAVVGVQLPSTANTAAGKHVYVILWNPATRVITVASELESTTGTFAAGRNATTTGLFRIGSNRGLVSAVFNASYFAAYYDPRVVDIVPLSLARLLHPQF